MKPRHELESAPPTTRRFPRAFAAAAALIVVLASFSAWRLSFYRTQADEIRDKVLRGSQSIQTLRDVTSSVRLVEASSVAEPATNDGAQRDRALTVLDDRITLSQHSFEHLPPSRAEMAAYADFKARWTAYRQSAARTVSLARAGQHEQAAQVFDSDSRKAYATASDDLRLLAERNLALASALTTRADAAYRDARFMTLMAFGLAGLLVLSTLLDTLRRGGPRPQGPT